MQSCHYLNCVLSEKSVMQARLLQKYHGNSADVLHFAFQHHLSSVIQNLISTTPISELKLTLIRILNINCSHNLQRHELKRNLVKWFFDKLDFNECEKEPHKNTWSFLSISDIRLQAFKTSARHGEHLIVEYLLNLPALQGKKIQCSAEWWIQLLLNDNLEYTRVLLKNGVTIKGEGLNESFRCLASMGAVRGIQMLLENVDWEAELKFFAGKFLYQYLFNFIYHLWYKK